MNDYTKSRAWMRATYVRSVIFDYGVHVSKLTNTNDGLPVFEIEPGNMKPPVGIICYPGGTCRVMNLDTGELAPERKTVDYLIGDVQGFRWEPAR